MTWFMAVLCWVLRAGAQSFAHPRRRQYSLHQLRGAARDLVLLRAAAFAPPYRPLPCPPSRNHARAGFIRRMGHVRVSLRQIAGAWMRRRLRGERGPIGRVIHLIGVLREIDAHARAFVARLHAFTRLRPLIPVRPPHQPLRGLATPAACGADSS